MSDHAIPNRVFVASIPILTYRACNSQTIPTLRAFFSYLRHDVHKGDAARVRPGDGALGQLEAELDDGRVDVAPHDGQLAGDAQFPLVLVEVREEHDLALRLRARGDLRGGQLLLQLLLHAHPGMRNQGVQTVIEEKHHSYCAKGIFFYSVTSI